MRCLAKLMTALGTIVLCAGGIHADTDIDLRGGYNADVEDAFVGGGVLANLGDSHRWYLNPNAEYTFMDDGDQFSLNGDVHYDFGATPKTTYWVGGGPTLVRRDNDFTGDETDLGVNLIAGMGARSGNIRPFAQGKVVLKDETEAAIAVGIRF